jgi:hypothetical protein
MLKMIKITQYIKNIYFFNFVFFFLLFFYLKKKMGKKSSYDSCPLLYNTYGIKSYETLESTFVKKRKMCWVFKCQPSEWKYLGFFINGLYSSDILMVHNQVTCSLFLIGWLVYGLCSGNILVVYIQVTYSWSLIECPAYSLWSDNLLLCEKYQGFVIDDLCLGDLPWFVIR